MPDGVRARREPVEAGWCHRQVHQLRPHVQDPQADADQRRPARGDRDEAPTTRRDPSPSNPQRLQTPPRAAGMPHLSRADSVLGDGTPGAIADGGSGPTERQWLVRLENGEQKTCRELATLQQWIVAGVATRESLISRSGKTWKRLGDIAELSQYFTIADEARTQRAHKPTPKPRRRRRCSASVAPTAAGGTILPDDGDEIARRRATFARAARRHRRRRRVHRPTRRSPQLVGARAPADRDLGSRSGRARRRRRRRSRSCRAGRATGTWASSEIKHSDSMASMPQGPRGGRLSMQDNEPAFAAAASGFSRRRIVVPNRQGQSARSTTTTT